jgi:hypothetical protein
MEPELEMAQGAPDLDNEGDRDDTVAEGVRWGAGVVHDLGPGELDEGAQGDGGVVCGLGGEERACVRTGPWARARASSTTRTGARTAGAARTEGIPDEYWRAVI